MLIGVKVFERSTSSGRALANSASAGNDVDIFIEAEPAARFNAFDLIDVKTILERQLAAHFDLTTRDGLHPRLRDRIEREAFRVF